MSPTVAYVHIPKTAGSSFNSALNQLGDGKAHVEAYRGSRERFRTDASAWSWISGHVPITELATWFDERPRFITIVREPRAQVRSHVNWLIEIHNKGGEFYEGHPEIVKRISQRLRSTDLSDPRSVVQVLRHHRNLFLNHQAKFFGPRGGRSVADWIAAEPWFRIGTIDRIDDVLSDVGIDGGLAEKRLNSSPYHFDPAVFDHPRVERFLEANNGADAEIWDFLQSRNGLWTPGEDTLYSRLRARTFRHFGWLAPQARTPSPRHGPRTFQSGRVASCKGGSST